MFNRSVILPTMLQHNKPGTGNMRSLSLERREHYTRLGSNSGKGEKVWDASGGFTEEQPQETVEV